MPDKKYVYLFADGAAEGQGGWRDLLGGKGAGLAEMTTLGIRVPPGFTLSTEACLAYYALGSRYPDGMWEEVLTALGCVERAMGAAFGEPNNPLLLSVRSGARASAWSRTAGSVSSSWKMRSQLAIDDCITEYLAERSRSGMKKRRM